MIEETSEDKGVAQVMAKMPLANLFGYTSDLRSATSGTASFSMEFSHYAPVREELADIPKKDEARRSDEWRARCRATNSTPPSIKSDRWTITDDP